MIINYTKITRGRDPGKPGKPGKPGNPKPQNISNGRRGRTAPARGASVSRPWRGAPPRSALLGSRPSLLTRRRAAPPQANCEPAAASSDASWGVDAGGSPTVAKKRARDAAPRPALLPSDSDCDSDPRIRSETQQLTACLRKFFGEHNTTQATIRALAELLPPAVAKAAMQSMRCAPLARCAALVALGNGVRVAPKPGKDKGNRAYVFNGATYVSTKEEEVSLFVVARLAKVLREAHLPECDAVLGGLESIRLKNTIATEALKLLSHDKELYALCGLPTPDEFADRADADRALVGFSNGVFDFRTEKFFERGSVPHEWVVTMSTGYSYRGTASGHPLDDAQRTGMATVRDAVAKCLPDQMSQDVYWGMFAAAAGGAHPTLPKAFLWFAGKPDAGKTMCVSHISVTLGTEYVRPVPQAHFTSPPAPDKPTDLGIALRAKVCTVAEVPEHSRIHQATLNAWTGGDAIASRAPHDTRSTPVVANAMPCFTGNYMEPWADIGGATWLRMHPIHFGVTFSHDPAQVNGTTVLTADPLLRGRLESLRAESFLCVLEAHRRLKHLYRNMPKPFASLEDLNAHVTPSPDAALTWLQNNYNVTADKIKHCVTCSRGTSKPRGEPPCPHATTVERLLRDHSASTGHALEGGKPTLLAALARVPQLPPVTAARTKNRHIDAAWVVYLGNTQSQPH